MMNKIDIKDWRPFKIGDLFDITKGSRLTKAHMIPGNVRFIGASSKNNGCTAYVGNSGPIHRQNTITVCYNGSVGAAFYQDEPYLASDDVNILNPKFKMEEHTALYLLALIRKAGTEFDYNDKWNVDAMLQSEITLPVTALGDPDWDRMKQFMAEIEKKAKRTIQAYAELI